MTLTAITAQSFPFWDLVPAAVGAIIGALAAGIPAWLLAKRQSDETLRRDREQRVERQKALAFSSGVKLLQILNSVIDINNHVKTCLAPSDSPEASQLEPWQSLVPMVGFSDEGSIRFTPEELAVFVAAKENELMEGMMLIAARHSATISAFNTYCEERNKFRDIAPAPERFDGELGSSRLTQQELNKLKPYTVPLNCIAVDLAAGLDEDVRVARSVAERFGPVTARYFDQPDFMPLDFPSDDELAAMRQPPDPAQ